MKEYTVYFYVGLDGKDMEAVYECESADEAEDRFRSDFGFDMVYLDMICRTDKA